MSIQTIPDTKKTEQTPPTAKTEEGESATQKTVQIVQEQKRPPWIEVAQDADGGWHWCLWSGNGRMMAQNAEVYQTKKHAVSAAKTLCKTAHLTTRIVQVFEE